MCPTTCDLLVCSNPKAVNPNTGELVFLARENTTGKLIWVKATEKNNPPPNQVISKATEDGRIPEELIAKLRESSGGGKHSPVLLIQGDVVNVSTLTGKSTANGGAATTNSSKSSTSSRGKPSRTSSGGGGGSSSSSSSSSPRVASKGATTRSSALRAKNESRDSLSSSGPGGGSSSPGSSSSGSKRKGAFLKDPEDHTGAEHTGAEGSPSSPSRELLPPPVGKGGSSSGGKPRSKRRKFDINHRKLKKPKRPKTGYNYFQLSIRDKLCDKIPMDDRVLHNETVARIIGKKWKALSKQERKVFQTLAEQDKTRYENELKEYLQKMYQLGAEGRYANSSSSSERKKQNSRRCFSFDGAMQKNRTSSSKKAGGLALDHPVKVEPTDRSESSPMDVTSGPGFGGLDSFFKGSKSKLGAQITSAMEADGGEHKLMKATDKWLDDALQVHMGRESRIRSSLSCEHIPLSSNLFSPVNLFSDKSLNDRKLQNPFGGDDLLMGATGGGGGGGAQSYMRDTPALFDNSTSGIKSPTFPSLANIDSMFFKEFSAWEADCE